MVVSVPLGCFHSTAWYCRAHFTDGGLEKSKETATNCQGQKLNPQLPTPRPFLIVLDEN